MSRAQTNISGARLMGDAYYGGFFHSWFDRYCSARGNPELGQSSRPARFILADSCGLSARPVTIKPLPVSVREGEVRVLSHCYTRREQTGGLGKWGGFGVCFGNELAESSRR